MPLLTPHVPNGLIDLMKDLAKEVLRDKPENIYEFAVIHFEKLILERDGSLDKGYEEFSAFEAYFDGQQRFAVPSNCGYICQRPIKVQAIPQSRKSKSDIMASFQAMESINEEDVLAPVSAPVPAPAAAEEPSPYDDEKYQNAIYVIQRYFRRYVARKKNPPNTITTNNSIESTKSLTAFTAAIIIQRTMQRLFSNKIKLKKDKAKEMERKDSGPCVANAATPAVAVKLVQDDMDNVSEAASYTSSSTIQMLADGQEGRENRLASGQRQHQQREEGSDGYGDVDGDADDDDDGEVDGNGDGVVGGAADFSSMEFKEPTQQEEGPPSSSSPTTETTTATSTSATMVVADDDEEHSKPVVAAAEAVAATLTEMDRKSIADENGNATSIPEEKPIQPLSASTTDDTSTAHNIGILSTKIGSNYNPQNLTNKNNQTAIDRNRRAREREPSQIKASQLNIVPAGLSVPLNYYPKSMLGATPDPQTLPDTAPNPHLKESQETFQVGHHLGEYANENTKNNDASSYYQGDSRIRKFDSDSGESLKIYDVYYQDMNDQEFSDSLNESTMEKDSLEPEELDVDSLESNENVVHHVSDIFKRDARQDDGSLYGDKNDDEEGGADDGETTKSNDEDVQKFVEIERVPTYLYGIHPARTPVVERRNRNRHSEEGQKVPDDKKYLEAAAVIAAGSSEVDARSPEEKSEEESLESKGSTSEESSVTQIENKTSRFNVQPDKDEETPIKCPVPMQKLSNDDHSNSLIVEGQNDTNQKENSLKTKGSSQNATENPKSNDSQLSAESLKDSGEDSTVQNNTNLSDNGKEVKDSKESSKQFEDYKGKDEKRVSLEMDALISNDLVKSNSKGNIPLSSVKTASEKLINSERGVQPQKTGDNTFQIEATTFLDQENLSSKSTSTGKNLTEENVQAENKNDSKSSNLNQTNSDVNKSEGTLNKVPLKIEDDNTLNMPNTFNDQVLEQTLSEQNVLHKDSHLSVDSTKTIDLIEKKKDAVQQEQQIVSDTSALVENKMTKMTNKINESDKNLYGTKEEPVSNLSKDNLENISKIPEDPKPNPDLKLEISEIDQNKILNHDQEIESQLQELQNLNDLQQGSNTADTSSESYSRNKRSVNAENEKISHHDDNNNLEDHTNSSIKLEEDIKKSKKEDDDELQKPSINNEALKSDVAETIPSYKDAEDENSLRNTSGKINKEMNNPKEDILLTENLRLKYEDTSSENVQQESSYLDNKSEDVKDENLIKEKSISHEEKEVEITPSRSKICNDTVVDDQVSKDVTKLETFKNTSSEDTKENNDSKIDKEKFSAEIKDDLNLVHKEAEVLKESLDQTISYGHKEAAVLNKLKTNIEKSSEETKDDLNLVHKEAEVLNEPLEQSICNEKPQNKISNHDQNITLEEVNVINTKETNLKQNKIDNEDKPGHEKTKQSSNLSALQHKTAEEVIDNIQQESNGSNVAPEDKNEIKKLKDNGDLDSSQNKAGSDSQKVNLDKMLINKLSNNNLTENLETDENSAMQNLSSKPLEFVESSNSKDSMETKFCEPIEETIDNESISPECADLNKLKEAKSDRNSSDTTSSEHFDAKESNKISKNEKLVEELASENHQEFLQPNDQRLSSEIDLKPEGKQETDEVTRKDLDYKGLESEKFEELSSRKKETLKENNPKEHEARLDTEFKTLNNEKLEENQTIEQTPSQNINTEIEPKALKVDNKVDEEAAPNKKLSVEENQPTIEGLSMEKIAEGHLKDYKNNKLDEEISSSDKKPTVEKDQATLAELSSEIKENIKTTEKEPKSESLIQNNIVSSNEKKSRCEDPLPLTPSDVIGFDGSSAETSADFSSIGKDLEFFEDTIKYLKNATENLGEMEDVFETQKNPIHDVTKNADIFNNSAVLIQSAFRGYQVRRQLKNMENKGQKNSEVDKTNIDAENKTNAAVKIQSAYRGHRVRKERREKLNESTSEDPTNLPSLPKEDTSCTQSPSKNMLGGNIVKSQIPVAVIHPTKYSSSTEDEHSEKNAELRTANQRSPVKRLKTNQPTSVKTIQKNVKTSPQKKVLQKRSIEGNDQTFIRDSLGETVKLDQTQILGSRKLVSGSSSSSGYGNKSNKFKTKTPSTSDLLDRTRRPRNVSDQFQRKVKSVSINDKTQSQESFDLEAIKKELLSTKFKSPPQSGSKKKNTRVRSGKKRSPIKQSKATKIPQKSPSKIINSNTQTKPIELISGPNKESEDHTDNNKNVEEMDLSKTFSVDLDQNLDSDGNIEINNAKKKTLNKTYTVRSSLNEVEHFNPPPLQVVEEKTEEASEDLFDSLKQEVEKLRSNVQEKSAVTIQKTFRGFRTRKNLNKDLKSIPTSKKEQISSSEYEEPLAIADISKEVENNEENIVSSKAEKKEDQAATTIQKAYRGYKTRKNYKPFNERGTKLETTSDTKDTNKLEAETEKEATKLNLNKSAVTIQKTFRGYRSRKKLKTTKISNAENKDEDLKKEDTNSKTQTGASNNDEKDKENSDVFESLQDSMKQYKNLVLDKSATTIQKHYRGYKTRKNYKTFNERGTKLENTSDTKDTNKLEAEPEKEANSPIKGEKSTNLNLNKSAVTIQKTFRGYQSRKHLKATQISNADNKDEDLIKEDTNSKTETDASNNNDEKDKENSGVFESLQDSMKQYKNLVLDKSATTIQKHYRGYKVREDLKRKDIRSKIGKDSQGSEQQEEENHINNEKKLEEPHEVRTELIEDTFKEKSQASEPNESATIIQKNFRGYMTRQNIKKKDINYHDKQKQGAFDSFDVDAFHDEALQKSATTIQKTFRGYKTRKDLLSKKIPTENTLENDEENRNTLKENMIQQKSEDHTEAGKSAAITQVIADQNLIKPTVIANLDTVKESPNHSPKNQEEESLILKKNVGTTVGCISSSKDELKRMYSEPNQPKEETKSSSAGAVLENAASIIQKAYRDYNVKRNNNTKSYSNGTHRETTPKEVLENSDESSIFIGPDTSFDLSDVDSVETKSEKAFNYDKINSSEAPTPTNNSEDCLTSTITINIHSEDKIVDNECVNTPQKLRLKRSIIEPTAPPLDEILKDEEPVVSPKLKWFVGDEPIIPSSSNTSKSSSPVSSSSVDPLLVSTSSKCNDLSSIDASNNSAVVSTSSLLLTNNTEVHDKNTLNNNSGIVSANEEEDLKKDQQNLEKLNRNEEISNKFEVEDETASNVSRTNDKLSNQSDSKEKEAKSEENNEDKQEDDKVVATDLCKNCAEGIHEGGVCSENLIDISKSDDQIKQFVLMEELNKTKSASEITEPSDISSQAVDSSHVTITAIDAKSEESKTTDPAGQLNSSNDYPAISLIPPSSEDDTSGRESSLEVKAKNVGHKVEEEKTDEAKAKAETESFDVGDVKTKDAINASKEDQNRSVEEEQVPEIEKTDTKLTETKKFSKENVLQDSEKSVLSSVEIEGKDTNVEETEKEDAFKTKPGEEFKIVEHGFEDDFSDSKDVKEGPEQKELELKKESIEESQKSDKNIDNDDVQQSASESQSIESKDKSSHELNEEIEKPNDDQEKSLDNKTEIKDLDTLKTEILQNSVDEDTKLNDSTSFDKTDHTNIPQIPEQNTNKENTQKSEIEIKPIGSNEEAKSECPKEEVGGSTVGPVTKVSTEDVKSASVLTKEDTQHDQLQEDIEIAAKLIESSLSDPQAKILENENHDKLADKTLSKEEQDDPDARVEAKLEELIEENSKPADISKNTVDPKDLPTENSSQEVVEEPCVKKVVPPTPYLAASDQDESELESTTTKAESTTTTPGYDETSETDGLDIPPSKPDAIDVMTEKLREPEEMVARMRQRRASEHKISIDSITDQQAVFEEPICEPIKPMEKIQKSSSTEAEDEFVLHKLQRGDTTRESSAQSESVVFGDSTSQLTESEDTFNENLDLHSLHRMNTIATNRNSFKPPHLFKSVTIDDTVKYIDPEKSTEESVSSFCMDDALSEDVRKKMMAYSVSEADSDYYDVGDQTTHPHDDFNISTALDNFPSTDTDTTIVSAATKIQAGARGFLTRRRIRRASMGTKASLTEDRNVSFGNEAIGESLDQLAEEEVGKRQFNRQIGVNSLPSALEHSDEMLSPSSLGEDNQSGKHSSSIKIEPNRMTTSLETNDVNEWLEKPKDDSSQIVSNLEATVARRLTLQRGDALRNDSTPDDENGGGGGIGKQVESAKNSPPAMGTMLVHEKTMVESTTTTTTRTTTERRNYSDAALTNKKDKMKWFALRQNSMPVQIDSEVFRVLPKHMRKRIKSAESEKPKRIRLPRD
ncbi:MATH and LRR domain-containing protein PFE0570w isoform X2 [Eupeodes corollae]|uniref:MATH and LRR domain-containing protein PFE0570w isoform X2 n=1 Tax=Eupeodes corollae TaxID=290404 RepID=UPI002490D7DA|nr:MATH and LRR domain-containing protein PFE0570w isoform X2 [Eupeodes corollae]